MSRRLNPRREPVKTFGKAFGAVRRYRLLPFDLAQRRTSNPGWLIRSIGNTNTAEGIKERGWLD